MRTHLTISEINKMLNYQRACIAWVYENEVSEGWIDKIGRDQINCNHKVNIQSLELTRTQLYQHNST